MPTEQKVTKPRIVTWAHGELSRQASAGIQHAEGTARGDNETGTHNAERRF